MEIIRGTTPTIVFTFDQINAENLAVGYLLIKQRNTDIIEKTLSDGVVSDGQVSFTLTQEDTMKLSTAFSAVIVFDWKTTGGVRGRSKRYECTVKPIGKDAII